MGWNQHRLRLLGLATPMAASDPILPPWLHFPRRVPHANLRLFCFPYAGAGRQIFRTWPDNLPITVELCVIQLPGREQRWREPPVHRLHAVADPIAGAIADWGDKRFALFGHSLGALVAFEVARALRRRNQEPAHLIVSGCGAPQLVSENAKFLDLSDAEFLQTLKRINGTPAEVLSNPELMQLLLPVLRADFAMYRTYAYAHEEPLSCAVTAFGGIDDPDVNGESIEAWRSQTTGPCAVHMLPGDHFFMHSAERLLLGILARRIR